MVPSPSARHCLAIALASLGCATSRPEPPPKTQAAAAPAVPATAPAAAQSSSLPDAGWSARDLAQLALSVQLPEAGRWKELPGSRWARLEHTPTRSLLELSVNRERRLVRPSDCEARARLERPELPRPAEGEALEQRRLELPNEMLAYVTVSVENLDGDVLRGHVTLFGSSVGRCLAAHFVTQASGAGRDQEVARRLRLVVDGVLPSLRLLGADQRVQPQPFER